MEIKEKIQSDFIYFKKSKNHSASSALAMLKSEITKAEKVGNTTLTNDEVLKVIIKAIKQREESANIYRTNNRMDLFKIENDEITILKNYLPQQMTEEVLYNHLANILMELRATNPTLNEKGTIGKAIGTFNTKFKGQADVKDVTRLTNEIYKILTQ